MSADPAQGPASGESPRALTPAGVPGRSDIALTLERQPAGDARGSFGRVFGTNPIAPAARAAFDRANGARRVARVLDGLGPDWVVLHAVPLDGRSPDADHVAVGPPGVLVVTSEHHRVKNVFVAGHEVFVDREKTDLMARAESSADVAGQMLRAASTVDVPVTPVLVFVDPKRLVVRERPERTRVFADLFLRRRLKRLPVTLAGEDLRAVQTAAVAETTWGSPAPLLTAEQLRRFDTLDRTATKARRLKSFWMWAGAVVTLSAVLLIVQGVALGIIG